MRVVEIAAIGGPENLRVVERPDPVAGPGEVVVAVEAAGVGLADALIRQGRAQGVGAGFVPGLEVAGSVVSVGEGVAADWVGRRVVAVTETGGGYAERAAVPATALVQLPDDLSATEAVALGINALVAQASLDRAAVAANERVLVRGARGGIGVLTVQLASARGATVVASVTDPAAGAELRELGAAEVVGPGPEDAGSGDHYDAIIDLVAGPDVPSFVPLLRPNGRYVVSGVSAGPPPADFGMSLFQDFQKSWTISTLSLTSAPLDQAAATLEKILADARTGGIRSVVHATLPLEEAVTAHRQLEARGVFGKIVLVV